MLEFWLRLLVFSDMLNQMISFSRLDTGVAGHGKPFANQEDSVMHNEESRSKRDGPNRSQSHSSEVID